MPLLTLDEIEKTTPLFRGRIGNAVCRSLLKILSVEKINELYDRNCAQQGPDFAGAVLRDIGVEYKVYGREIPDTLNSGPFITVSNHPYGSIDGVILADLFGHLRPDYKILVNRILARIEALGPNFINVTPTGNERTAPTKDSIAGIKEAVRHVREGHPLGIFPSGAVSDLSLRDRCIRDREWQEPIIRLIMKLKVPIVPVKFADRNSLFYYGLGLIDWRVRLLRLPSEVFNKRGKEARVIIGPVIPPERQAEFPDPLSFGKFLRDSVYSLPI